MPVLRVLKGRAPQREYVINDDRVVLGRDLKSDIYLERKDVSRAHVAFERQEDHFQIIDLESHNHTYVNGKQLDANTPVTIRNNDLVKVCNFIFVFQDDSSDSWMDLSSSSSESAETVEVMESHRTSDDSSIESKLDSSSGSWEKRISVNPEAKLSALMKINQDLRDTLGVDEVLSHVLDSLLAIFPLAQSAIVVFPGERDGDSLPTLARYRHPDHGRAPFNRALFHSVFGSQRAVAVLERDKLDQTFSIMSAPLLDVAGKSRGVFQLDARGTEYEFTHDDLDLLSVVSSQVAFRLEDSRQMEAALRQRTTQRDLELARDIQLGLLPSESPQIPNYEFFDHYVPAREVGGDYYDYFELPNSRLAIVVGDVAGKGVPAALLMAKLSSEVRVHLASGLPPVEVMNRVNKSFAERAPEGSFVTMVIAVLNYAKHELEIANAGHMRPLVRGTDTVQEVGDPNEVGCPLGVLADQQFQSSTVSLHPHDTTVLYSDGVTDAVNDFGQRYQLTGLQKQLEIGDDTATKLGPRILRDMDAFVGDHYQADDICLLCITRLA